jgi:EmrB/QacA subfamily drug resistance transporter
MIMLDTTIVNVAIPTILRDLHATLNEAVWVNSVYLLTFAVPLLFAGRLGDRLGRKPMFLAGMVIFTLSSLGCGLSNSIGVLIAARAVQGLGAAAMAPQTMAFITHLFPPAKRGAPMGAWGGVGAMAGAAGPLLGGVLVGSFGWRWIFIVNVPIGVIGALLAVVLVPSVQSDHVRHFDVLGTLLSGLGLLMLVFGLQSGQQYHWRQIAGPITITEVIATGVVLLMAFVIWQRFNAHDPLLPLSLLRHRNFTAASVAVTAVGFVLTGMFLPVVIYLQSVRGMSPMLSGLTLVATALGAGIGGPVAGRLSDRINGKYVIMTGFVLFGVGIGLIAALARTNTSTWQLSWMLFLCGLGGGSVFAPLANVATSAVPLPLMGAAAGVYNTARQVGSVFGSAAIGVLLQARLATGTHTLAVAQSPGLPPAFRQRFISEMGRAASAANVSVGPAAGTRSAAHLPGAVASQMARLAVLIFHEGFTQAMRFTLVRPIVVLALGFLAAAAMSGRSRDLLSPGPAEVIPVGDSMPVKVT